MRNDSESISVFMDGGVNRHKSLVFVGWSKGPVLERQCLAAFPRQILDRAYSSLPCSFFDS
jgi:hypothetical protein